VCVGDDEVHLPPRRHTHHPVQFNELTQNAGGATDAPAALEVALEGRLGEATAVGVLPGVLDYSTWR
jgi:hypothetical protein